MMKTFPLTKIKGHVNSTLRVNEQICCSEVLLLTVLMYTSSAISKALYELAGQDTF